jgi:hypothetical protein
MQAVQFLGGVDEAGLGPILGPFALGAVGLWAPGRPELAPGETPGSWPWRGLADTVSADPKADQRRLIVADSKVVFGRNERGRRRLERTVLSFWCWFHGAPGGAIDSSAFFASAMALPGESWTQLPWSAALPKRLPLWTEAESIQWSTDLLARSAAKVGLAPGTMALRLVPETALNAAFERTQNKGTALWEHTAAAIQHLWTVAEAGGPGAPPRVGLWPMELCIDRQGGRARYGSQLARELSRASIELIAETEGVSRYRATPRCGRGPAGEIAFREQGEQAGFATALASCLAKYGRELCMEAFNRHFERLAPGLEPTAGYATDGRRWLAEAARLLPPGSFDPRSLVRQR